MTTKKLLFNFQLKSCNYVYRFVKKKIWTVILILFLTVFIILIIPALSSDI